jgi:hypothetical protein
MNGLSLNLSRIQSRVFMILTLVFFYILGHQPVFGDSAKELDAIIKAWEEHENKILSFSIMWSGKTFIRNPEIRSILDSPTQPMEDVSYETKEGIYADIKGRYRLDYQGQVWSDEKKAFTQNQHHTVFDGKIKNTYFPQSALSHPTAHIDKGDPLSVINILPLLPIRTTFRPFDKFVGVFDKKKLVLTNEKEIVNGHSCLVLKYLQSTDNKEHRTVCVDPSMDFVPVKICDSIKGLPSIQVEVSFVKTDKYDWIPNSWNISVLNKKGLIDYNFCGTVTDYKINEDIPDSTFQLIYKAGTFVFNSINNENYIVLENNEKRIVKPREYNGKNYEQLK